MYSLKINDIELSDLIIITNINRSYTPKFNNIIKKYNKSVGAHYTSTKIDTRTIEVQFSIIDNVNKKSDELLKILKPSKELRIIFGDQSDRFYLGYLEGMISHEKITDTYVKGSFTILCVNPFAYSNELKTVNNVGNKIIITNNGIYDIYPTFSFKATSDIKMFSLVHPKGTFQIGEPGGNIQIQSGSTVFINMEKNIVMVGNNRLYTHISSRNFSIESGTVEIKIIVDAELSTQNVEAQYREVL